MNLPVHHLISSTTLLASQIKTASTPDLHLVHSHLSLLPTTPPDHIDSLIHSVLDTIKVELSTRKPQ